ncbi:MAG: metal ABC transporter substrate-binding protein [Longimicrobiales bacterium]
MSFSVLALVAGLMPFPVPGTDPGLVNVAVPGDDTPPPGLLAQPSAPVRVVATLPVYAAIVRAIGGEEVVVTSIADPREDAHFVRPKPSFALEIRRTDVFVTTGLDLELWAPALLDRAANSRVLEGGPGYVSAFTGIRLLDVPASVDRSAGDIHVYGNPHIFTDPLNAIQIARNIAVSLKKVAPDRAAVWDEGVARFSDRVYRKLFGDRLVDIVGGEALANLAQQSKLGSFLETTQYEGKPLAASLGGWLAAATPFRGKQIICYHKDLAYFEQRFDVHCAGFVEAKPGIPPTPGHVARLIGLMQERNIDVLVASEHFGREKVAAVASRANATAVMFPAGPGTVTGVTDYFSLVDLWISRLAGAFHP